MKTSVSVLAVASLIAAPADASVRDAAFASSADRARAESSIFIGANYGVSLGRKTNAGKARASFKIAGMVKDGNAQFRLGEGLALTAGTQGKPAFLIGGQDIGAMKGKANLGTGGTVALVVVGLAVIGGAVAALAIYERHENENGE
jgi:hypothetical protein